MQQQNLPIGPAQGSYDERKALLGRALQAVDCTADLAAVVLRIFHETAAADRPKQFTVEFLASRPFGACRSEAHTRRVLAVARQRGLLAVRQASGGPSWYAIHWPGVAVLAAAATPSADERAQSATPSAAAQGLPKKGCGGVRGGCAPTEFPSGVNVPIEKSVVVQKTFLDQKSSGSAARIARARFVPPTLEQVAAYCLERGNQVDPQRWFDYYTSNGWCVGRNGMRDWRAAVRTWERNGFHASRAATNGRPAFSRGRGQVHPDDVRRGEQYGVF